MKCYSTNFKRQLRSYRYGWPAIPYCMIYLVVLYLLRQTDTFFDITAIVIYLLFHAILSIPALILHIQYYRANRGLKALIDKDKDLIELHKNGQIFRYNISDLTVKQVSMKNRKRLNKPIPWEDYGYLRIDAPDSRTFNLTSLMIDPFNPPIKVDRQEYKILPLLEKSMEEQEEETMVKNDSRSILIQKFKSKYKDYPLTQIEEIAAGVDYQEEAREAAKELLVEKNGTSHNT